MNRPSYTQTVSKPVFLCMCGLGLLGCPPPEPTAPLTVATIDTVTPPPPKATTTAASRPAAPPSLRPFLIERGGVGPLRIGQPLPQEVLGPDAASRYVTTFYADAQPLEGFRLEQPPLTVFVKGGPFYDVGMKDPAAPVPADMAERAVSVGRNGELVVQMLVITAPGLETASKVSVGSRFDQVMGAHPTAKLTVLPGLWEEPSCIVALDPKHRRQLFFAKCQRRANPPIDPAEAVIRIVIREPG